MHEINLTMNKKPSLSFAFTNMHRDLVVAGVDPKIFSPAVEPKKINLP